MHDARSSSLFLLTTSYACMQKDDQDQGLQDNIPTRVSSPWYVIRSVSSSAISTCLAFWGEDLFLIFDYYCHTPCFHFKSPLSNSVPTVHYCACCLHIGASRISRSFYWSGEHRNADSCQTDPTKEGAVYHLSLFDKESYLHELMSTVQNTLPAQQR